MLELIVVKSFPTLYKNDSKGKLQTWKVAVTQNGVMGFYIRTVHGKKGGKLQVNNDLITKGKNGGKANETSPQRQAELEAEAKWTKQIERKGYVVEEAKVNVDTRPGAEPMLAHRYDKYPEKITYPAYVQPKLDGHRCIAIIENGAAQLFSRQRKPITGLPHIEAELISKFGSSLGRVVLDGELYNHDFKDKFEELTGFIRSQKPKEGHEVVQYHIYDMVTTAPQLDRTMLLAKAFIDYEGTILNSVYTQLVENEGEALSEFRTFREEGFEGAILRNLTGAYVGKRSYDLQKVKEFDDAEFTITGVEEGRGKMAGHAIFVLIDPKTSVQFKAKMKGTMETLAGYFKNPGLVVGKTITVQFQGRTKDGIPRFPVATRFRKDI